MTKRIPCVRIVVEGFVIVVSILLAFALDAGWEQRAQRNELRAVLSDLAEEFHAAGEHIDLHLNAVRELNELGADLLVLAPLGARGLRAYPTDLVAALIVSPTLDPPTGVTESLLGSGRVELLPSELRVRLTGWPAAIEDALEEQLNLVRLGEERLRPTLNASATDLGPAYDRAAEWGRNRTRIVREGDGVTQLMMSSEFRNLLLKRQKVIDNAASEIESLRAEARNIAALIDRSR